MEIFDESRPDGATHEAHGVLFIRTGECLQCGACGCSIKGCVHAIVDGDRVSCSIYGSRDKFCEICGYDHQYCIDFPGHPFTSTDEKCGFTFTPVSDADRKQYERLVATWR